MITILLKNCNDFSQDFYDQMVEELPLNQLECTCGKKGCLTRYGHYPRGVKYMSEFIKLKVQRLRCSECRCTHAIIPSILVPYSQAPLEDQQAILYCYEYGRKPDAVMDRNFLVDENNIKHILRQFRKHWKQRLLAIGLTLKEALTEPCFSAYSRQFMQIHRTQNILFCPPT